MAVQSCRHIVRLDPTDPRALYRCAVGLRQLGEYEEAARMQQHAFALKPHSKHIINEIVLLKDSNSLSREEALEIFFSLPDESDTSEDEVESSDDEFMSEPRDSSGDEDEPGPSTGKRKRHRQRTSINRKSASQDSMEPDVEADAAEEEIGKEWVCAGAVDVSIASGEATDDVFVVSFVVTDGALNPTGLEVEGTSLVCVVLWQLPRFTGAFGGAVFKEGGAAEAAPPMGACGVCLGTLGVVQGIAEN
ncbi:hypothetical protein HPB51_007296 [Rhipicephalus microplus]|uniref:Uncharacterized protein n=1 Tax=Rhipicephalus microplus TaxID=6941 RepID=A0A9J6EF59_RHIMP|nr:hypothetical protein HPB51_007296 [Rhipicephalus microplus]